MKKIRDKRRLSGVEPALVRLSLVGLLAISGLCISACGSNDSPPSKTSETNAFPPGSPMATIGSGRNKPIARVGSSLAPRMGKVVPAHWRVVRTVGPREIEISSAKGYCVGAEPPPKYEAVRVVRRGSRIYVTAFVPKPSPSPGGVCAGVGYGQFGTIQLEQKLKDVQLYDTSTSPPGLRWPEPRR